MKNWYIEVDKNNLLILNEWRRSVAKSCKSHFLNCGKFILSKHFRDGSFYWCGNEEDLLERHPGYEKINLQQFLEITDYLPDFTIKGTQLPVIPEGTECETTKGYHMQISKSRNNLVSFGCQKTEKEIYVLAEHSSYDGSCYYRFKLTDIQNLWKQQILKTNEMKDRKITSNQAQSIIDIACTTWKLKLSEKWAYDIVLKKDVVISEDFYQEMRKVCTSEQNVLFDEIFGKDNPLKVGDWVKIIQPNTHSTDHVFQLTEDHFENVTKSSTFNYDIKYNISSWEYPSQVRLATEDEIKLANFPKDGTPCLVKGIIDSWCLRYSNGKGEFYNDGKKSGYTNSWKNWMILDMNNLP